MRVRKSATRMAYVRENGWDDLSEGGNGTLISLLVTDEPSENLNPRLPVHVALSRFAKHAPQSRLLLSTCLPLASRT